MTNTATRLITLIMLLQRQPNQSARQLAQELEVSVRTLQRYITMLEDIGIPVYAERGPYGGYSLVRGYRMPPLVFTPEEAVAVALGTSLLEQVWGRLYQQAARGALAKLDNVLPDKQREEVRWARDTVLAIGMNWSDPNIAAPFLEQLYDAIRERRTVRIAYRSHAQPTSHHRVIDPYHLVVRWGVQYCIAWCHERQDVRTFRLERITALDLLHDQFDAPVDFDLEAFLASNPFFQPPLQVRLQFAPDARTVAFKHRIHWDSIEEQSDGSLIVTFTVPNLEAAAGTVLRIGWPATILEPLELYPLVREQARAIAAFFDAAPDP